MKQKYKSPKDPQENVASKEVKKKVIFMSQFCPMGRKDIVTGQGYIFLPIRGQMGREKKSAFEKEGKKSRMKKEEKRKKGKGKRKGEKKGRKRGKKKEKEGKKKEKEG